MLVSDDQARIVRFWQAVEVFSPQELPKPDGRGDVFDFGPDEPMPWEQGSRDTEADEGKVWRHEVFCGVYELRKVRDVLVECYGQDNPEAPVKGESALFACTVDADGFLVEQSAVLSSCAWATGQILRGRSPLAGFPQDATRHADDLGRLAGSPIKVGMRLLAANVRSAIPDAVAGGVTAAVTSALATAGGPLAAAGGAMAGSIAGKAAKSVAGSTTSDTTRDRAEQPHLGLSALTGADLHKFSAQLADSLGVTGALEPRNVRVRSYQVSSTRLGEEPHQSFLNSFYADDLDRVADELGRGNVGRALVRYLTRAQRINTADRIDIKENPLLVLGGCAPDRTPLGRWVTGTDRSLAFSQQFAVNQAIRELADHSGLLPVNGPPGTGKTTMLRDLIAAIIVRRAIELSCLDTPRQAFGSKPLEWRTEKYTYRIKVPTDSLTGFEVVVASSNNGAVENVTTEIPGPKGIGDRWRDAAASLDYFTGTARHVHGDGAWAMIAARLGKHANRRAFVEKFWWDGVPDLLKGPSADPSDWQSARTRFRRALERVNALSAERGAVSRTISHLPVLERERVRAASSLSEARTQHEQSMAQQPALDQELRDAEDSWQAADAAVRAHRPDKPGPLAFLSGRLRSTRKRWDAEHAELRTRFLEADRRRHAAMVAARDLRTNVDTARQTKEDARTRVGKLDRELRAAEDLIDDARQRWGEAVPCGPEYAAMDQTDLIARREKSAPWADEEFAVARTELFLAALALHKALIAAEPRTIRENLSALMDILDGKGRPGNAATLAVWQTFFLMVPVVSSTFASFDRLFRGISRESLGWLLIDEAGQAAPQYAVGALWRSRRAVIVGDPKQLEPVVTLPWGGQQALLCEFGVGEEWGPSRTSVQQLADRLARHGTSLPGLTGDDLVWVGTPLRVHRRCDRPMFDISNAIAYDGLMVFGTRESGSFHGRDGWYDVRSSVADGHWIPAEGEVLHRILVGMRGVGIAVSEIRVISPFRKVVSEAKRVHEAVFPEVTSKNREKWVGTVHTMQGKEADAVILVLGGNPEHPGARTFATRAPNLLNVAVTRARRRLYVIGNQEAWGKERYFDVLAARISSWHLPSRP